MYTYTIEPNWSRIQGGLVHIWQDGERKYTFRIKHIVGNGGNVASFLEDVYRVPYETLAPVLAIASDELKERGLLPH